MTFCTFCDIISVMIYFTEVLMPRETISVSHLTDKSQLANELVWADFKIKTPSGYTITPNDFDLIAIGNPNQQCEKWDMDVIDSRYHTKEDLIYALVIDGKLLKLGKSITSMKKRIQSYHCGKNAYREKANATNSATNWYILQSVLAINLPVYIYVLYAPRTDGEFKGWTYHNRISKEIETKLIAAFYEQYGTKPIGNKQS